jgi:hypothetical protein
LLLLFFPACRLAAQPSSNAQKFSPPTRTFRFTYNFQAAALAIRPRLQSQAEPIVAPRVTHTWDWPQFRSASGETGQYSGSLDSHHLHLAGAFPAPGVADMTPDDRHLIGFDRSAFSLYPRPSSPALLDPVLFRDKLHSISILRSRVATTQQIKHLYEFGPYRIDPAKRLLLRGEESVLLPSKVFETLLVLVQHSKEVVPKDDLLKTVWPDSFVEESNLSQSIFLLRKALDETAQDHR